VAELHRRVVNQRRDFAHKVSRRLVDQYDALYTEDLRLTNMVQLHNMAQSFHDAGFGMLKGMEVKQDKMCILMRFTSIYINSRFKSLKAIDKCCVMAL